MLGPLRFTNALGGLANFVYPGPTTDMQSPASAGAVDGVTYRVYAQSLDMSEWEICDCVYTSASKTFTRPATVVANSLGTTAKVDFSDPPQVFVIDTASSAGVASPSNSTPLMDGTGAAGTSLTYSRGDHRHPSDSAKVSVAGGETLTGGYYITVFDLGNWTPYGSPINFDAVHGNYQAANNNGAMTIYPSSTDSAIDLLVTNVTGAGAITFSGFTVGANTGDALTTTVGHKFIISFRRMKGISTYMVKALQ
jgi:hypothetical protein